MKTVRSFNDIKNGKSSRLRKLNHIYVNTNPSRMYIRSEESLTLDDRAQEEYVNDLRDEAKRVYPLKLRSTYQTPQPIANDKFYFDVWANGYMRFK